MLAACILSLHAMDAACLNSSIAELWALAGGQVTVTVQESVDRGVADDGAILVDTASGRNINSEVLIASGCDLVLGSVDTASHVALKGLMDSLGIRMVLIRQDSFSDFLSIFRQLTSLTGREDLWLAHGPAQGEEIASIVDSCTSQDRRPRVLFVRAGSAFSSVRAKGSGDHFAAGIIEDLGGINVADEYGMLTESLSLEAMLRADIDKILIVAQGNEEASRAYMEDLLCQPGWRDLGAEVVFLPKDIFHFKPNGRWSEAYRVMAEALYG